MLLLTVLSLAIFAAGGVVRWRPGLALGVGNALGALVGVRLAVTRGHAWIQTGGHGGGRADGDPALVRAVTY